MDGVGFTLLCTQGTADASGVAFLLYVSALIVGITLNQMLCLIGHQIDQMAGTYGRTGAAGHAFFLIDHSHAVHDVDGVELAGLYTASGAQTAIRACLISGSRHGCGDLYAVIHTVVIILDVCLIAGALTFYKGHHLFRSAGFHAHDGRDLIAH